MIAAPGPDVVGDPSARLRDLFEGEWQQRLADDPMMASRLGDARFGDRTPLLNHPYFAGMSVRQWRKFHWRHTVHHMKQVSRIVAGRRRGS